ncbi:hypothetical protein IQ266_18115 [filamentous cyanobacterium LEGE 11480]|uniref:Uncharacterized protein n=1 Tax=Romeriopsis navalis LEGE 11480 TaxID=2777977 RepID=A0A928Z3M0_9CYAN|nr:hypothetical protein [Romeriopsis navalis]MBE9031651.1 hypothetical protein [Romeriopsis navalis LEGE 11480]
MDNLTSPPNSDLPQDLAALSDQIQAIAVQVEGDSLGLLALLRLLERLHRTICEEQFHPSLPDTRQALYTLLRDIEAEGGWPHIPRMKIQALMSEFLLAENAAASDLPPPT